ncbi:MAG: MHYT domain-containing protein [Acidobacteriaceae bacterium]
MTPIVPSEALSGTYDYRLVALSVLIAVLASYAALDLGGRVTASNGRLRSIWLMGGAAAMGMGIWSMHYIGMLAYHLPVAVFYNWPTVLLSLLAAVLASAVALFVVSRNEMGPASVGIGGLLMGTGIATMHYVGMEAMRLPATCQYSLGLVALSVALAIVISLVALWLTFNLRAETNSVSSRKLASAMLMGAAIPIMHYTGMAAANFSSSPGAVDLTHSVEISSIGIVGIGGVTFMILFLAILTSLVDRRFSAQSLELHLSEQRYRQLVDSAQVILWRGGSDSTNFSYINQEAADLLGYPIQEWTRKLSFWIDHVHPEDRALAEARCRAVAEGRGPERFEHRMIAADGRVVWLRTSVRLVSGNGESKEIAGVMTDITDRKLAQEAAEEASRTKSGLLAEINSLHDQLKRENTRMGAELEITQRLQQMMLPRDEDLGKIAGLNISGSMEPAAEVGGDYYDVVCQDGGVLFAIGDVTGHGLESGVIAIMVQTVVRTLLASGHYESRKFLKVLNRVVYDNVRRMRCDRNLTLSLLHYQDKVVAISGQHEEVLVVRGNGVLERHDTLNLGFPLGLEEDISSFHGEVTVPLRCGDVMVAYTDGITEAMNCANVPFGVERLCEAVRRSHGRPADSIRKAVLNSLREYTGGQELLDDISLLVIKPI